MPNAFEIWAILQLVERVSYGRIEQINPADHSGDVVRLGSDLQEPLGFLYAGMRLNDDSGVNSGTWQERSEIVCQIVDTQRAAFRHPVVCPHGEVPEVVVAVDDGHGSLRFGRVELNPLFGGRAG